MTWGFLTEATVTWTTVFKSGQAPERSGSCSFGTSVALALGEEQSQESPTYKGPDSRQVRQVAASGNSIRDRGGVAIAPQGCTTIQQRLGKRSCGGARQDSIPPMLPSLAGTASQDPLQTPHFGMLHANRNSDASQCQPSRRKILRWFHIRQ